MVLETKVKVTEMSCFMVFNVSSDICNGSANQLT